MPNIEQQLFKLNSRLNQYSQLLDMVLLDEDLSKWDKLLLIMHFGARLALINIDIKKIYQIDISEPMTANAIAKLQAIKNTARSEQNLFTNQNSFLDFAESVYVLGETNLLVCAVQQGARLSFNSFFKGIYDEYCASPELTELMQTLYTLVYDISFESMPWEGANKYIPSLRCNTYLNGTINLNNNTLAQPVLYAVPQQLVQYYIMPQEVVSTVTQVSGLAPVMSELYPTEPEIVSLQPTTVPVELAQVNAATIDTQQAIDLAPPFLEPSITTQEAVTIESENNIEKVSDIKTEVASAATKAPVLIENPIAKAVRLCDSVTCNAMLNDPQQCTALFNELEYNIRVVFTGKVKQLEFINELQLTLTQLLSIIKITQPRPALKVAICKKILNFEDKILYETLHEKNNSDILGSLGQHLSSSKTDEKNIKQILRKRFNEYLTKITRESVEAAKAIESAKVNEFSKGTQTVNFTKDSKVSTTTKTQQNSNAQELTEKPQKSKKSQKSKNKMNRQQTKEQDEFDSLPIEIDNVDIIKNAIKNNDYRTINNFSFPSEEEANKSLLTTILALRDNSNTFTDEFLENIEISHPNMVGMLLIENISKQIARVFLNRIVKFNDELFFAHNIKVNFITIFDAIFKEDLNEDEARLKAAIEYKTHSVNAQARLEYKKILDQLQDAQPGAHLDINSYVYAANVNSKVPDTNDLDPKTILMLAIEKKIDIEQIILLAKNSAFTIISLDINSKNIFHYWAEYQTPDSSKSIEHIWEKYSNVTEGSPDAFEFIAARSNDTGDTFMHTLIKNNDPQQILIALNALLPQSLNLATGTPSEPATSNALGCALFKADNLNKTPLDYIEELEKHQPEIEHKMIGVICMLSLLTVETTTSLGGTFFPNNRPLFGINVLENIKKLLATKDYNRILHLITLHDAIRQALQQISLKSFFAHLPAERQINAITLRNAILNNFGKSELQYMIEDKPLHQILNEEAIKPGNSELLENMQRELFRDGEKKLQIRHTLAWLRIDQHLKNLSKPLSHKEIHKCIGQLKPRVNIKDLDGPSMAIDYAISATNLAMIQFLHKDCRATILPQIVFSAIMFAFGNTDGNVADLNSDKAAIVNYLFDNFKETCSKSDLETLSSYAYEYATLTKDVNLAQILKDKYKLKIHPRSVLNSILFAFDNKDGNIESLKSPGVTFANYIFKISKIEEDELEFAKLNATLYEIALQDTLNIPLLVWMTDNDFTFDIEYTHGKRINLFQKLIANADASNIKDVVELLTGMLDAPVDIKQVLDSKDPEGHTFIYSLFASAMKQILNHNDLNRILERCLNQKANFSDIGLTSGNALHLASMLNNHSLVALILDKAPRNDLITMLRTTNSNGKNIVDSVDAMVKAGKCDISIYNLLDAKYKQLVSKTLLNVMENTKPLQSARLKP